VVGVVANSVVTDFTATRTRYGVYEPWRPSPHVSLVVRTDGDARSLAMALRRAAEAVHPQIVISASEPVVQRFEQRGTFAAPRFIALLVATFAAIALLIAAVGLHGLIADAVRQRQKEFAVRLALGSGLRQIAALVMTDALRPVCLGIAAGSIAATWLMRYIAPFLFEVSGYDLATFVVCALVLTTAALTAVANPLKRAMSTDAIQALKAE
jgi:putative ABC transport system permease protein